MLKSKIFLTLETFKKIRFFTDLAEGEVSGLGKVERSGNDFIITDVYCLKQYNTGASTELDSEDIAKLLCRLYEKKEDVSLLKFWWHSHANFGAFWSGTDTHTISEFAASNSYLISLVTNKNGDILARLDIFNPIECTFDNVELDVMIDAKDAALKEECQKELEHINE